MTPEMTKFIEKVIEGWLPIRASNNISFAVELQAFEFIRNNVFEKLETKVNVKENFKDFIEIPSNAKTFTVKKNKKADFFKVIENLYPSDDKEKAKIVKAIKEIIKKPASIESSIEIYGPIQHWAIEEVVNITSQRLDKAIKIKESFKNMVKIITRNEKCFEVKKERANEFFQAIKNEYENKYGEALNEDTFRAMEMISHEILPIRTAFSHDLATELAGTSIVASIADTTASETGLIYIEPHFNIKRELYFGEKGKQFKEFIDMKNEEGGGRKKMYTVKPEEASNFIHAIKQNYEAAGYLMHPFIEKAIQEVIRDKKEIPGIPGLHAEVLAVNNELFRVSANVGLNILNAITQTKAEIRTEFIRKFHVLGCLIMT